MSMPEISGVTIESQITTRIWALIQDVGNATSWNSTTIAHANCLSLPDHGFQSTRKLNSKRQTLFSI